MQNCAELITSTVIFDGGVLSVRHTADNVVYYATLEQAQSTDSSRCLVLLYPTAAGCSAVPDRNAMIGKILNVIQRPGDTARVSTVIVVDNFVLTIDLLGGKFETKDPACVEFCHFDNPYLLDWLARVVYSDGSKL